MPTTLTKYSPGGGYTPPRPQTHGAVHAAIFEYTPPAAGYEADNPIEIGRLPSFSHVVDAYMSVGATAWLTSAPAAITCQIGFMDGTPGSLYLADGTTERTVGTEIFAAATAMTAEVFTRMSKLAAVSRVPTEAEVSIGVKISADLVAAGGSKLTLVVFYMQYTP